MEFARARNTKETVTRCAAYGITANTNARGAQKARAGMTESEEERREEDRDGGKRVKRVSQQMAGG